MKNIKELILTALCNAIKNKKIFTLITSDQELFDTFATLISYLRFLEIKEGSSDKYYSKIAQYLSDRTSKEFELNEYESISQLDMQSKVNNLALTLQNVYNIPKSELNKKVDFDNAIKSAIEEPITVHPTKILNQNSNSSFPQNNIPNMSGGGMPPQQFSPVNTMDPASYKSIYWFDAKPKIMPILLKIRAALFITFGILTIIACMWVALSSPMLNAYFSQAGGKETKELIKGSFITNSLIALVLTFFGIRGLLPKMYDNDKYHIKNWINFASILLLVYIILSSPYQAFVTGTTYSKTLFPIFILMIFQIVTSGLSLIIGTLLYISNPKVDHEALRQQFKDKMEKDMDSYNQQPPNNTNNSPFQQINMFNPNNNSVETHQSKTYKPKQKQEATTKPAKSKKEKPNK